MAQQRHSEFQRELWEKIQTIDRSKILDDQLYRQVRFMSTIGPNALPPDQFDRVCMRNICKINIFRLQKMRNDFFFVMNTMLTELINRPKTTLNI